MSRILIILFCILAVEISVAQEEEGAAAPAEGAKTAEGGKPASSVKNEKGSAQQEILDLQARLMGLKTKIKAKKDNLKKLVTEKQGLKDEKKSLEIFNEMKSEYKEMQVSIKDYDEQIALLHYRYPEKGLSKERKYERIELKTLDEMEKEFSLQGKIKKTLARVRQQFPDKKTSSKNSKEVQSEPLFLPKAKIQDPSRDSVTEPQLLSK